MVGGKHWDFDWRAWRPSLDVAWCMCLGSGLLILASVWLIGVPASALDGLIHARWLAGFRTAWGAGDAYPRWIQEANLGLGSPAFYLYPPVPYLISAWWPSLHGAVCAEWDRLTNSIVTCTVVAFASAYWMARRTGCCRRVSVILGVAHAMSLEHLTIVCLERCALGEAWAHAWMPAIVTSGLRFEAARFPGAWMGNPTVRVCWVAMTSALLLGTHLLSAQIFFPLWMAVMAARSREVIPGLVLGVGWGFLVAAIYLLPVPFLLPATCGEGSAAFKGAGIEGTLVFPEIVRGSLAVAPNCLTRSIHVDWAIQGTVSLVGSLLGALLGGGLERRQSLGWFLAAWFCVLLATPVAQPLYELVPSLRRGQFGYRALSISPVFLLAGACELGREWIRLRPWGRGLAGATLALWLFAAVVGAASMVVRADSGFRSIRLNEWGPDANGEYLPNGVTWAGVVEGSHRLRSGTNHPILAVDSAVAGEWRVRVAKHPAGWATLPLLWFPTWTAVAEGGDTMPLRPEPGSGLLQLLMPADGVGSVLLRRESHPAEIVGLALTCMAMAAALTVWIGCAPGLWLRTARMRPTRFRVWPRPPASSGFSMVELLVTLAVMAILAALLLPLLARGKRRALATGCLGQVRQFQLALDLYAEDSRDRFPPNRDGMDLGLGETWVRGWMGLPGPDCTNVLHLRESLLGRYLRAIEAWKCPASGPVEVGGVRQARIRSYSLNGFLGSPVESPSARTFRRRSELVDLAPGQALTWVEERAETINDGSFSQQWDFRLDEPLGWVLRDQPATLHGRSGNVAFADGHVATRHWLDFKDRVGNRDDHPSPGNRDVAWLQQHATLRDPLQKTSEAVP